MAQACGSKFTMKSSLLASKRRKSQSDLMGRMTAQGDPGELGMTSLSKLLRTSCAIATSGALVLSSFPAIAQGQPAPETQLPPPPAASQPPPEAVQQPPQPAGQQLGQGGLSQLIAPVSLY